MTTMTAYDSLNLFDKLAFAIRSIVMRSQTAQPRDNRSWVYQRAQERFEYLVEGGDLINLAPIPAGEPLVNVLPEHRDQLLALGYPEGQLKLIGGTDVAAELDAKRAIRQGTELAAAL